MRKSCRVAVLISGRGSNLKSLIENAANYEISLVLSNNPEAPGKTYAEAHKIGFEAFRRDNYKSVGELKAAIRSRLIQENPRFVCLAGFMLIVDQETIEQFPNRILNIHPSLLPNFPGLDTHERAVAGSVQRHGCTVHLVDRGVDTGLIVAQAGLDVRTGESAAELGARVLALEHQLYPWVVNNLAAGNIELSDGNVKFSSVAKEEAERRGFLLP
ncbi:MAG: phosphoribosylglycinamide formyltransferase [Oligoflexia bacterium]|nr:phosphoribosylglycinamide formyltransferase [Oligoflexia bacterium]